MSHISIAAVAVTAASVVLFVVLERLAPYARGQKLLREGLFTDIVWYTGLQNLALGLVIAFITDELQAGVAGRLQWVSSWPLVWQLLFFLVLHDFYIYWFHRWQHHSKWLWRLHEAHHSTKDVDWMSGTRSHALEILINQTVEFAPMVILGAAPSVVIMKGVMDAVWGMYIHSNINIRSGRLQYFINGPEMHRWHHADGSRSAHNRNFSTKLALWDWIFGTAYLPADEKPQRYGLDAVPFPKHYLAQQWFAFRPFGRHDVPTTLTR